MVSPVSHKTAFFLGKGGVGKTTLSASFALTLARSGQKVLVASLDPAHNLGDALGSALKNEPLTVEPNLDAMEIDLETWINTYLEESRSQLKSTYSYNVTLNLDSLFKILKYSPGTEEYAVLWAIEDIHCRLSPLYDIVVLDTPPTALSLRFLSMPTISGLWVKELSKLRETILEKRSTLVRLNPESPVKESCLDKDDDKVYGKLSTIRQRLSMLEHLFQKESFINVIVNPDELSVTEALRIKDELDRLEIPISTICLNKKGVLNNEWHIHQSLAAIPMFSFDFESSGIRTRDQLIQLGTQHLVDTFLDKRSIPA
ncbi:MAG: ArsA family ATPase [Rectinema sp.]|jgi:arsenite-transporting ATPase|uniref:arsenite-transporting ATPase n=1 Tax=uncultured spirochete TaxID=156406 RepID=A0A3P3XMT3_9SPIR|nr:Arsenite-transporting ATPase [uncultured spirochete]